MGKTVEDLADEAAECIEACNLSGVQLRTYLASWLAEAAKDGNLSDFAASAERTSDAHDLALELPSQPVAPAHQGRPSAMAKRLKIVPLYIPSEKTRFERQAQDPFYVEAYEGETLEKIAKAVERLHRLDPTTNPKVNRWDVDVWREICEQVVVPRNHVVHLARAAVEEFPYSPRFALYGKERRDPIPVNRSIRLATMRGGTTELVEESASALRKLISTYRYLYFYRFVRTVPHGDKTWDLLFRYGTHGDPE
jgi:hypothetical protein